MSVVMSRRIWLNKRNCRDADCDLDVREEKKASRLFLCHAWDPINGQ